MSKIKVVIIEDHELMRFGIVTALSADERIEVCGEADNGFSGLNLIKMHNPELALVDINLPDIDGAELCQKIKNDFNTKVIILTADKTQDTVTKAFKHGADSYCIKNLPKKKLAEAVYATYQGESWIDSTIGKILIENMKNQPKAARQTSKISHKKECTSGASTLSQREIDVLQLIAQGMSNEKIAAHLYISIGTVRSHVHRILQKLNCENRSQVAIKAISLGLVETPMREENDYVQNLLIA
ncbi:response regulator transcription factor [Aetokthonos hydrillicola Thurmond2011]|jgi:DNA-binding NarL/FixJ family response regulator|uniref:Response regulator transcription factor n=1 Tax=Aetokthonos hydrillicola Thurmond2011 TaxID=2712845 RepID=A0AAP5IA94_9CYAN|nr:response regulator transcription factor [Aetokthonos hydrillicola]MBO3458490.1 response regulator transcription factor [Aetokthonos hydrillicola CCALA 1050]MBW4586183.1 response regulator transcription factor [Aetokthonos hydrillicola CCALA 1050]MDR9897791.1 response regulator transcription factor [Aetokthonos hydrillicola Thurmond2011]